MGVDLHMLHLNVSYRRRRSPMGICIALVSWNTFNSSCTFCFFDVILNPLKFDTIHRESLSLYLWDNITI